MASTASKARPSRHPWHWSSDQLQATCDDTYLKCHQHRCTDYPFCHLWLQGAARRTNSTWLAASLISRRKSPRMSTGHHDVPHLYINTSAWRTSHHLPSLPQNSRIPSNSETCWSFVDNASVKSLHGQLFARPCWTIPRFFTEDRLSRV